MAWQEFVAGQALEFERKPGGRGPMKPRNRSGRSTAALVRGGRS
jgi:hypothetical protein